MAQQAITTYLVDESIPPEKVQPATAQFKAAKTAATKTPIPMRKMRPTSCDPSTSVDEYPPKRQSHLLNQFIGVSPNGLNDGPIFDDKDRTHP